MQISDAVFEYLKQEIAPLVAGESEITAGCLKGALRSARKKLSGSISSYNGLLQAIDLVDDKGEIKIENVREFIDGAFEDREVLRVSLAEILKAATGLESDSELLQDKLKFTRADAEKFLALLTK